MPGRRAPAASPRRNYMRSEAPEYDSEEHAAIGVALGVQLMQLGIALHATAVLEQPRIVARNALQ